MNLSFLNKKIFKKTKVFKAFFIATFLVGCATNLNQNENTNVGVLNTKLYQNYIQYGSYKDTVKELFAERLNELNRSFGTNKIVDLKFGNESMAAVEQNVVYVRDSLTEYKVYCNNDCPVKHLTKNSRKEKLVKELNLYSQKHYNTALSKKEFGKMLVDFTVSHELGHIFYPEVSVKTPLNALPFYLKTSDLSGDIGYGSNLHGIANEIFAEAVGLRMIKEHYPKELFEAFLQKRSIVRTANTLWELSEVDSTGHREHFYKVLFDNVGDFLNAKSYQELAEISHFYALKAYKEVGVIILETKFNSQEDLNWYLADYSTNMNRKITRVTCGQSDCLKIAGLDRNNAEKAKNNPEALKQQIYNEISKWNMEIHY